MPKSVTRNQRELAHRIGLALRAQGCAPVDPVITIRGIRIAGPRQPGFEFELWAIEETARLRFNPCVPGGGWSHLNGLGRAAYRPACRAALHRYSQILRNAGFVVTGIQGNEKEIPFIECWRETQ